MSELKWQHGSHHSTLFQNGHQAAFVSRAGRYDDDKWFISKGNPRLFNDRRAAIDAVHAELGVVAEYGDFPVGPEAQTVYGARKP